MNLLVSIFGGMALTALLYGVGRQFRLSNFWASVLAAGVPSGAYLLYAFATWPGLDVVTMHVVAYPTVSVLLYQLYDHKPGRDQAVHWVPKMLIAFFLLLTTLLGGFVYIAVYGLPPALAAWVLPGAGGKTLHTGFAGVVEHGDEAAKSIAHRRNIDARLSKLGWQVEVIGVAVLASGQGSEVQVLLRHEDGSPVTGQQLSFGLGHPGQAPMVEEAMQEVAAGDYRVRAALPSPGRWLAYVTISGQGKNIRLEHAIGQE